MTFAGPSEQRHPSRPDPGAPSLNIDTIHINVDDINIAARLQGVDLRTSLLAGLLLLLVGCAGRATALSPSTPASPVDSTDDGFSLSPYDAVVRGKVLRSFEHLNRGDASVALGLMDDKVRYRFEGEHALGGERISRKGMELWFSRLFRLLRSRFVLRSIKVTGWPWATTVYTVFDDHVTPMVGTPYVNHGVQIADLRWGKAVRIRTFIDTALMQRALDEMAAAGIAEAHAAPIVE